MVSAVESVCRVPSFTGFSFWYCGCFFSWKTAATAFARAEPIDRSARPVLSVRACVCPSLGIVASTLFDRTQSCGRCTFHVSLSLSLSVSLSHCLTVSLSHCLTVSFEQERRKSSASSPVAAVAVWRLQNELFDWSIEQKETSDRVGPQSQLFFSLGAFQGKKTEAVDHFSLPFTRPILRFEEQWQRCRIV